jgi:hypothetical protein
MRYFSSLAVLIGLLGASLMCWDIDRPFYGLHSVDQAHNAWLARSHVVYGVGYTRGYPTFEVGYPPSETPGRYLDHPMLYVLVNAGAMTVLGVNTWSLRVMNIVATVVAVLVFMRIVRALSNDATALLSGLVLVQLPIITYFGLDQWLYPLTLSALWCYLVLIRAPEDGPRPRAIHFVGLVLCLFLSVQVRWQGCFFAVAFGVHYASRCLRRRRWPRPGLSAAIAVPSVGSLLLNFVTLASGDNWNFGRLAELFGWRAGSGERDVHEWGPWFAKVGEFAVTNFTPVVLIVALAYLTLGQLWLRRDRREGGGGDGTSRRFPQFWLFLLPGLFQLFVLKGVVWEHQWWERPFAPLIAIATALGVLILGDLLRRIHRRLGSVGIAVATAVISASAFLGTKHYQDIRYYYPERLEMFEAMREEIPPDQALLSFESYFFDQKPGVKQGSYRPEVAWHLNRDIVVARLLPEIEDQARTGRFPYYLMPATHRKHDVNQYLAWLTLQMRSRYTYDVVRGNPDQWVFDLRTRRSAP